MFEERIMLRTNDSDELFMKSELLKIFWKNLKHINGSDKRFEFLLKKGENFKFSGLDGIMLYPLISDDSEICRINYGEFAKEALKEIDNYRIVNEIGSIGAIYKIIENPAALRDKIKEEGDYLISVDKKPKFKISTARAIEHLRFESVKIISFNNKEFLNYIPSLVEGHDYRYKIDLEISVLNKDENELFYTFKEITRRFPIEINPQ